MLLIVTSFLLSLFSLANVNGSGHAYYSLCKNGNLIRTIRIDRVEDSGVHCKTRYTKFGQEKTVGWAKSLKGCQSVAENIYSNLTRAGWKCRDISRAKLNRSQQMR